MPGFRHRQTLFVWTIEHVTAPHIHFGSHVNHFVVILEKRLFIRQQPPSDTGDYRAGRVRHLVPGGLQIRYGEAGGSNPVPLGWECHTHATLPNLKLYPIGGSRTSQRNAMGLRLLLLLSFRCMTRVLSSVMRLMEEYDETMTVAMIETIIQSTFWLRMDGTSKSRIKNTSSQWREAHSFSLFTQ